MVKKNHIGIVNIIVFLSGGIIAMVFIFLQDWIGIGVGSTMLVCGIISHEYDTRIRHKRIASDEDSK